VKGENQEKGLEDFLLGEKSEAQVQLVLHWERIEGSVVIKTDRHAIGKNQEFEGAYRQNNRGPWQ